LTPRSDEPLVLTLLVPEPEPLKEDLALPEGFTRLPLILLTPEYLTV